MRFLYALKDLQAVYSRKVIVQYDNVIIVDGQFLQGFLPGSQGQELQIGQQQVDRVPYQFVIVNHYFNAGCFTLRSLAALLLLPSESSMAFSR